MAQTSGGAGLRRVAAGSAYLVVHFPPQAVLERVLTDRLRLGDLPLPTRVAGPSRPAFDITSALPMALTLENLLGWTGFAPRLAPTATVVFVPDAAITGADQLLTRIHDAYDSGDQAEPVAVRTADTGGRRIALARPGSHPAGSTTATVDQVVFNSHVSSGAKSDLPAAGKAPFHPHLERAVPRLPEVAALTGTKNPDDEPKTSRRRAAATARTSTPTSGR
ncbi:hypothetical protein [Saccharothrix xinjiangensis]|uniref:Uncharacterized protein n=1 Tax=Saccharothrix xinjiangensis TaxID=204798 RepID=A0ABV9YD60_9PSEU